MNESNKTLMAFEICGEIESLHNYDVAIEKHKDCLKEYLPYLSDFPYTVKKLKDNPLEDIQNVPIYILYNKERISLYEFVNENRKFESQLKRIIEINGLERIHEFGIVFSQQVKQDQYHAVIIETFRVLQDLSFSLNTARYALIQAHRILHFRSEIDWSTGWEQLWTRAAWLNNAIVLYNSCFDKLIQSVWIAFKAYVGYQKKKGGKPLGKPLLMQDLYSKDGLNRIYSACDYNKIKSLLPSDIRELIDRKYDNELKNLRTYANRIKHRGGMRYKDLFPYGNILEVVDDNSYSSFRTQITDNIDDVVEEVKKYHMVFCDMVDVVFNNIMEEFKKHDYLKERINKVVFSKKKDDEIPVSPEPDAADLQSAAIEFKDSQS